MNATTALFGTAHGSTWRQEVLDFFKKLGPWNTGYISPGVEGEDLTPEILMEDVKHMYGDDIVVIAITGDGYEFSALLGVQMAIHMVQKDPNRFCIIMVDESVKPELIEKNKDLAAASNELRSTLRWYLEDMCNERLIFVQKVSDIGHAILDAEQVIDATNSITDKWGGR